MTTPTTTLGAIVGLFDSDATLTADVAGTGGLWVGGIPEDKNSLPLVCLVQHGEVPEWNFEAQVVEDRGNFDLIVYAKGLAAAELIAAHIKAVFDPKSTWRPQADVGDFVHLRALEGSTATNAWIERQDYRVKLVEYRAADSTWVYEVTLPYKSFVSRLI